MNKKVIVLSVVGLLLTPFLSYAATLGQACSNVAPIVACTPASTTTCTANVCVVVAAGTGIPVANPNDTFADVDFLQVVTNIANLIISFIAILGIIFIVYGGIMYVTSAGDETRAEDGKRTVTYAIIGLFLAASAYAIEKLVLVTIM